VASFLVNGLDARSIDADDRGLMYGDGVFRTLAVRSGRALNWVRHYRLLARDCGMIGLPCPEEAVLIAEMSRISPGDATVKIVVTRGTSGRGYAHEEGTVPTRVVAAYPAFAGDAGAIDGVRVRRCELVLAEQPLLAGVKSLNRLENVLARAEWRDPAIREGLLADAGGRLVEGTMSNVFLTVGDRLVTPAISRCGVSGAQRERILDIARAEGMACEVRDVDFGELAAAGEVFLTNSLIGVWPVIAFGDRHWLPGPVARRMQQRIAEEDARGG